MPEEFGQIYLHTGKCYRSIVSAENAQDTYWCSLTALKKQGSHFWYVLLHVCILS